MRVVLASSNKGKIQEIQKLLPYYEVVAFKELLGEKEIEETGSTFQQNALLKAQTVYELLQKKYQKEFLVISDDSGLSVPALGGIPGIYSARYAQVGASDTQNLEKLVQTLKKNNLQKTPAYYTACIAIVYQKSAYTTHGWMHGEVIDQTIGNQGFGYDPMFIPKGFNKTLGELDYEVKKSFSHRSQALFLAKKIIEVVV